MPDELADEIALCGSKDRIRDRLQAWEESRVGTIIVSSPDADTMRFLAEETS